MLNSIAAQTFHRMDKENYRKSLYSIIWPLWKIIGYSPLFWGYLHNTLYYYYFCHFDSTFGGLCHWIPLGNFNPTEPIIWPLWKIIGYAPLAPLETEPKAKAGSYVP